jgi:hypothetical protein
MTDQDQKPPRVFISYSWTSPEHVNRIVGWAERLVGDGVDVILDKWDLKEGHDKYAFMEQMIADPSVSKVLIFSDSLYAQKADERKGGVGTESQIISAEIYQRVKQEQFIPIVLEFKTDGQPFLPVFLANRIFIDFSSPAKYYENYEQLLRTIFDIPLFKRPRIGSPPKFLTEETKISFSTTPKFELFKNAIVNDKPSFRGLAIDYFDSVISCLEELRISKPPEGVELDEFVVTSIASLRPLRDEIIQCFIYQAKYKNDPEIYGTIFSFFEESLKFKGPKKRVGPWNPAWADHLDFVCYELFIYFMAILIRFNRLSEIRQFVERHYLLPETLQSGRDVLVDFRALFAPAPSLRQRNERLKLNRLSVKADLLQQGATFKDITFDQFMQADFVLMIMSVLAPPVRRAWYPSSLVYAGYSSSFELFLRASSHSYFAELAKLLNVKDKADLISRFAEGAKIYQIENWTELVWHAEVSFEGLMNLDRLDTQP